MSNLEIAPRVAPRVPVPAPPWRPGWRGRARRGGANWGRWPHRHRGIGVAATGSGWGRSCRRSCTGWREWEGPCGQSGRLPACPGYSPAPGSGPGKWWRSSCSRISGSSVGRRKTAFFFDLHLIFGTVLDLFLGCRWVIRKKNITYFLLFTAALGSTLFLIKSLIKVTFWTLNRDIWNVFISRMGLTKIENWYFIFYWM